ncbi:helix-turn-helix transcriptional regulator [Paenibacillus sp. FSL R7-0340]|uniref:helix-turn-helix domain-containing protein n=1 Tax=Paenibacillus sp. FSL R7-0340 TaxID=2921684 RepID=UPI0030F9E2D0
MANVSRGRCLLQNWLNVRKMTQAEFARRSGINVRTVSHYCNNDKRMSVEALYMAHIILDVPMERFYEWTLE